MHDKPPQALVSSDPPAVSQLAVYRACAGTVLLAIGVVLGIYVATAAFEIIDGAAPPGMVQRFASPASDSALEQAAELLEREGSQIVDLTPDAKKAVLYVFCFFFLLLPATVATTLVKAGASLLHQDATEAIKLLAERLKRSR